MTINNSEITTYDDSSILAYEASNENQNSKVVINNSSLSAPNGGIIGVSSGLNGETHGNFSITFNNSTVQGLGLTSAEDDVNGQADSLSENLTIISNDSKLSGIAYVDGSNSKLNLTLNNSSWSTSNYFDEEDHRLIDNSLTSLSLNKGTVNLEKTTNFQTLTIFSNLSGSGTFNLNTNIAENKSDKIVVKGSAEGNHKIGVTNQGANVANGKVTLVETNGGNAAFSLTNPNNRVDLGAYQYFLTKEGNNWVLVHSQKALDSTSSVETNVPDNTGSNNAASNNPNVPDYTSIPKKPLLTNLSNIQVSLRQAQLLLVEDDLTSIHQRLGEVKNGEKGNVWVRNVNSHQKLGALSTGKSETSGFKQNVHSLQVGADTAVTDNLRVGGFVGRSQANVDFNGDYGDGKVRSNSLGLYAAYLADNGIYVDNIVKYSRLHANSDLTEKRHYNAYTISSELGKRFSLVNDWTITPQAQLAWTHISSQENEDSLSSVYSRIGLRVAKGFALSNGWNLQPYAEVNAITSKNRSSKIHYTNSALDVASSRGRFESAVGLNAGFANHRFGLEVSRADGKNFDKPYAIQAVYRYQW